MNLEFIQDLWDKDSIIDNELLHNESTKIPALHAKYYKIYNNILTLKKAQETQYKILKKDKWIYYSGKASPEVYKEKPFDYKVLKADLDKYFEAADKLNPALMRSLSSFFTFDLENSSFFLFIP